MKSQHVGLGLVLTCVVGGASTVAGQQHRWKSPAKASGTAEVILPVNPRAIGAGANGIYCPDMTEGAVGVHDLGWVPANFSMAVTIESFSQAGFHASAAVIVASVGEKAGNAVKVSTFYDTEAGGGKDPKISFKTPQDGTYVLIVTDYAGSAGGCYRYQVDIR